MWNVLYIALRTVLKPKSLNKEKVIHQEKNRPINHWLDIIQASNELCITTGLLDSFMECKHTGSPLGPGFPGVPGSPLSP